MNKFIKIISLSLLLGLSFSSCEDVLDDNVNPDKAYYNNTEQAFPVIMFYASQIVYDHTEYNVYLSQCLTTMSKAQTGTGYPYKCGWEFLTVNRHPQWRRHYYDIAKNIKTEGVCDLTGTRNVDLIARTIILMSTQLTTDSWGAMPMFKEQGGNAHETSYPKYESQPFVYNWLLTESQALIDAFENHDASNDVTMTPKMDRIYNGDLNKWKGLVYALRARILLRNIPNIDTSVAKCEEIYATAEKALQAWSEDAMYGKFLSEPRYNYPGGSEAMHCSPWSEQNHIINSWESRNNRFKDDVVPSRFFMESCLGLGFQGDEKSGQWDRASGFGNDPRIFLLMTPTLGATSPSNEKEVLAYRFLDNNYGAPSVYKREHYPNLYEGAYAGLTSAYNPLFTIEELLFIQAEAKYWAGDKEIARNKAKEATELNIQRHLDAYQLKNGAEYYPSGVGPANTAAAKNLFENLKRRFFENTVEGKMLPLSDFGNKHYFFKNAAEYTLSDLMMQKYIALYLQPEQWTDLRRYHYSNKRNGYMVNNEIIYPALRRPYNLYPPHWIDGLSASEQENCWIQRLNYEPTTEEAFNKAEVEKLGAFENHEWLRKPMIWAMEKGERTDLISE